MRTQTEKTSTQPKQRHWQSDITTLIQRILVAYFVVIILQIAFYMLDKPHFGHIASATEAWSIAKGSFRFNTMSVLWTNCLFIFLSVLPFRIREKRWYQGILYAIYLITNSLSIILNGSDIVYFSHTMKRMTIEELHFTNNSNDLPIVLDFLQSNLSVTIVGALLIGSLVYGWHYIKYQPTQIENNKRYYLTNTLVMVIVMFLCVSGMRGTFNPAKPWTKMSEAAAYSPEKTWLTLSNPYCLFRSLDKEADYDNVSYFTPQELDELFTTTHHIDSSRYNLGRRNVVVFILESFSKEHSKYLNPELYEDEIGYTPFLDSLMQKGYTFTQAYANGSKSIEAMPAILASIPSFKTSFTTMPERFGDFEAIPEILAKQGYETAFFSGSERNSMGFEDVSRLFGIKKCYCRDDFKASYPVNDSTIEPFWGVYDMPYFQFMADEICRMQEPFLATVFSLTSHHPYRVPPGYEDLLPRAHNPEQRVVAYTDMAIRKFFERAKSEPWFENTLFVFVADHVSPIYYDPQRLTSKGRFSIISFLYTPDGALRNTDSTIMQQLDLMPTVLGLLGNKEPYFAFGRDVFNEPERQPIAFNCLNLLYQCITDSTTILSDEEKVVKIIEGSCTKKTENTLKAVLQRYAESLSRKEYTVK
jgi:phosphoglycerol transferase MdoB-like AlkP superfamily enzyme